MKKFNLKNKKNNSCSTFLLRDLTNCFLFMSQSEEKNVTSAVGTEQSRPEQRLQTSAALIYTTGCHVT